MGALGLVFGLATLASLALAVYEYLRSRSRRSIERIKVSVQAERLRESRLQLIAAAESANMIVQRAKEQDVRIEELKNLARQMRGQLAVIINGLDWDLTKLEGWEFGKYFRTVGPEKPGPSALDQK